jgi:hypothetical protein
MHANYHHDDQKRDDEGRSESVQGARRYGHHPPECGNDRSGTHAIASADRAAVMNLVRVSTSCRGRSGAELSVSVALEPKSLAVLDMPTPAFADEPAIPPGAQRAIPPSIVRLQSVV